ncbi:IclR family transcriptional regulator [Actinocorallia populi]|uniref:IclR family transcriptional regulator n=1 Tax=Actinocorallia populi TaxID=2079200 RepID=UPI000D097491|nr:IclR family transcriptional regulator [Actinocorallia populi]
MDGTRRPTLIASVQRALHLMETVVAHPSGAPAKQLARLAGLPLATTYHLLRTLAYEGYVTKLPDGGWVLGERLEGLYAQGRTQMTLARVRPVLAALRDELGVAVYFAVHQEGEIRLVDVVDGPRERRVDLYVGFDEAAHATAIGKCLLGQLDEPARGEYLTRHPLLDLTPHTITDRRALARGLAGRDGFFYDREEYTLGTVCVAVPVADAGGLTGALAVSCRAERLPRLQGAGTRLHETAARLARLAALS